MFYSKPLNVQLLGIHGLYANCILSTEKEKANECVRAIELLIWR